ncbi:hypothetical protein FBR02_16245 [Anaerolineae bacterium CFX9]|nr:hypothetical protein [Anaerolineae bacterium CFX9]
MTWREDDKEQITMERKTKLTTLALGVLLTIGVGQFNVLPSFAQAERPAQVQSADACVLFGADRDSEADVERSQDVSEVEDDMGEQHDIQESGADTEADTENQHEEGHQDEIDAEGEADHEDAAETAAFTGSIALDEAQFDGMTDAEECAMLISLATVTPEAARAAAETETGSVAVKVKIDDENGFLVYEVEMQDGSEVKVDAGNAAILLIEPADAEDAA